MLQRIGRTIRRKGKVDEEEEKQKKERKEDKAKGQIFFSSVG